MSAIGPYCGSTLQTKRWRNTQGGSCDAGSLRERFHQEESKLPQLASEWLRGMTFPRARLHRQMNQLFRVLAVQNRLEQVREPNREEDFA